jgi:hypothetical protein
MVLRGATSLWGALEGVGPENRDFFGPWNGTSEASAIWAQMDHVGVTSVAEAYTTQPDKETASRVLYSIFESVANGQCE